MEHSHPLSTFDAVRPWRTATMVASAIAAAELLILVLVGIAMIGKPLSKKAEEAAAAKMAVPLPKKTTQESPVKLTINISPDLHAALTAYAALYAETYRADEPVSELVPLMLANFLESDRAFSKRRKARHSEQDSGSVNQRKG